MKPHTLRKPKPPTLAGKAGVPGYRLTSDAHSFVLEVGTHALLKDDHDNVVGVKEEPTWRVSGYYVTIAQALKAAVGVMTRADDRPMVEALTRSLRTVQKCMEQIERKVPA